MRSSFFAAVALATSSLASPLLKRAEGLKVSVAAPSDSVSSIDDLVLTATITNTGSETVKVLKYGTILDALPTRSFKITKDDADVSFTGVKVSVDLNGSNDAAFVTIPSGETYTVTHALASIYDFESVGTGSFTITPLTDFRLAETDAKVTSLADTSKVDVQAESITVEVSSDVAKRHSKKSVVECNNSSEASFISASYTEAKELASLAASYATSGGTLYTAYFGTNSQSTVASRFTAVANENSSSRTLSCTDEYDVCDGNVIAYTLIATTDIYFCDIFFDEVPSTSLCSGTTVASRNVRGGTTLHELTHAVDDTDDVTYGCSADQALSNSNKLLNADNYNCFSTAVYQAEEC